MRSKIIKTFLGILLISLFMAALLWKWFGRDYNLQIGNLHLDFFNTICGCFTIIALAIAIFQIADLKDKETIQKEAVVQSMIAIFKKQTISELGSLKTELEGVVESISRGVIISRKSVESYIGAFFRIEIKIDNIQSSQQNLTGNNIIDCSNLVTLHSSILSQLQTVNSEESYKTFPKQNVISEIGKLIKEVNNCNNQLIV